MPERTLDKREVGRFKSSLAHHSAQQGPMRVGQGDRAISRIAVLMPAGRLPEPVKGEVLDRVVARLC